MVRNSRRNNQAGGMHQQQFSPTYNPNEFSIPKPGQPQQHQNMQQQQPPRLLNQKVYIFYSSRFCEHSKRCMDRLQKNGLISEITLCDIDSQELVIPPFIQVVPTIYLSGEKRILTDKDLFEWLETNNRTAPSKANILSMSDVTGDQNVFAYQQNEMGGSSGYAFIEDNQNDFMSFGCEFIDGSNKDSVNIAAYTRAEGLPGGVGAASGGERNQRQDDMDKAFQKMMDERNREMQNSITTMRK